MCALARQLLKPRNHSKLQKTMSQKLVWYPFLTHLYKKFRNWRWIESPKSQVFRSWIVWSEGISSKSDITTKYFIGVGSVFICCSNKIVITLRVCASTSHAVWPPDNGYPGRLSNANACWIMVINWQKEEAYNEYTILSRNLLNLALFFSKYVSFDNPVKVALDSTMRKKSTIGSSSFNRISNKSSSVLIRIASSTLTLSSSPRFFHPCRLQVWESIRSPSE